MWFDLKLWRLHFASPTAAMVAPIEPDPSVIRTRWGPRVWVIIGTVYVAAAIYSSVSYLGLAQGILTNDLIWPAFNMTGSHSFLANWFNEPAHVQGAETSAIALTNHQQINALELFNLSQASVAFPIQQGARVQYSTLTTLSDTISGLRDVQSCDGPWVFTQYCYLDLDQKWEMANSIKRQERCQSMVSNGAVFLASLLRNVDISTCWSESFEIGFASELRESKAGQALLASFSPPYLSIDDEVSYWTSRSVSSYVLQWQNYKSIGLVNSYNIVNAYGISYPFTLQSTAGYRRLGSQTSFKMYWSLANDLGTLVKNTSIMGGKSLLRSSSRFAYRNASIQDVLVTEKMLPALPWSANSILLTSYLGPFGSIDTVYVSPPRVLQEAIAAFGTAVAGARVLNAFHAPPLSCHI
ncbi:hypothetical protein SDRG_14580 [Saprolegnia diclina VS20]|uniref:Uncharacterized protein n=1 Tax=Saprolegnia diclina (strain VS20) TaxID=1156394 RepID=T0RDJ4_SAPDV|nr:hypothetical protein SDRG_14580 [Saprolegnia diclina VS20]EQC27672.1 hypothetical protein SDRG_14580 [Saprolegnia diclina VS20]|eukprot:XP_008618940.1 hypothetical protein SDRG_14580 [Saprolegnia diclina VS20]